jgi:alpha-1,3-glucosyltransferase
VEPASVALRSSRGYESPTSRLAMRLMVLASDVLVFYSGVLAAADALDPLPRIELLGLGGGSDYIWDHARLRVVVMAIMSPALVIIDHGHFQFNCVCLGLSAWAVAMLARGHASVCQGDRRGDEGSSGSRLAWHDLAGSALFVMAMCFKQIALYYAPAFFFYLLGRCLRGPVRESACLLLAYAGTAVRSGTKALPQSGFVGVTCRYQDRECVRSRTREAISTIARARDGQRHRECIHINEIEST